MRSQPNTFVAICTEMERINTLRSNLQDDAFETLEAHDRRLSDMLVIQLGDRRRASIWMASRHLQFDGRSGYQVLAEGEGGLLWDLLEMMRASLEHEGASKRLPAW